MPNPVTEILKEHYSRTFDAHGATAKGVDWGPEADVYLRYDKMLAVIPPELKASGEIISVLDVGCGYGGLYEYAKAQGYTLNYTGVDVCDNMIAFAKKQYPDTRFMVADVLTLPNTATYDYVVCSGILTQKLSTSIREMDRYSQELIQHLFNLSRNGIAFNVMSTRVNFMADNLYYRNPVELLAYCLTNITGKIRLDHAYPLYEYTMYLYREPSNES